MARNRNKNRVFRFNRRIRGQTDYGLRLKLLRSNLTRVVVRRSNNNVLVQFVDYSDNGDKIIASAKSTDLKKLGYTLHTGNVAAAYLTGLLAAKRAQNKGFKGDCILDIGLQRSIYGNRLYAAVKGVKDQGVSIRVADLVFPSEERLNGEHLKSKDAKSIVEKTKKSIGGLK